MTFNIVFTNETNQEYKLSFAVYNTDISSRWYDSLLSQENKHVVEKDRMYNFPTNEWTEDKIVHELNFCIGPVPVGPEGAGTVPTAQGNGSPGRPAQGALRTQVHRLAAGAGSAH